MSDNSRISIKYLLRRCVAAFFPLTSEGAQVIAVPECGGGMLLVCNSPETAAGLVQAIDAVEDSFCLRPAVKVALERAEDSGVSQLEELLCNAGFIISRDGPIPWAC